MMLTVVNKKRCTSFIFYELQQLQGFVNEEHFHCIYPLLNKKLALFCNDFAGRVKVCDEPQVRRGSGMDHSTHDGEQLNSIRLVVLCARGSNELT